MKETKEDWLLVMYGRKRYEITLDLASELATLWAEAIKHNREYDPRQFYVAELTKRVSEKDTRVRQL